MALPPSATKHAETHFGVVTDEVLRRAGLSQRQVRRLVTSRQLERLHVGIYRVVGVPRTWEQAQAAACLASEGVSSHRAALRLWFPNLVRDVRTWPVELTVRTRHRPRLQGVTIHRSVDLDAASIVTRHGIPVTNPLRMLADLASVVNQDELSQVVDECVVSRLLTIAGVQAAMMSASERRVRGASLLRKVTEDWPIGDTRPDSVLEVMFARLCRRAGLPSPVFQYELTLDEAVRRVDFAFPDLRIAIEVDGFRVRTDRDVFQRERRRQNDFAMDGWTILRFTWHHITNEPDYVVRTIENAIAAARRRVG